MTREEATNMVLDGLSFLIINHATCCASEQYYPSHTDDESNDYIKEHKEWVESLRKIRYDFENLITGIIE